MDMERKAVRGGLVAIACLAAAVTIVALREAGGTSPAAWATVAASMAVLASVVAAWNSLRIVEMQEDVLLPRLTLAIDARSRYGLTQVVLTNRGGSAAYRVKVAWRDPIPLNIHDTPVEFGLGGHLPVLGPGEQSFVALDGSVSFFQKHANEVYTADVSFTTAAGERRTVILDASAAYEANSLDYVHEDVRTYYELQKLPKAIEQIAKVISKYRPAPVRRPRRIPWRPRF